MRVTWYQKFKDIVIKRKSTPIRRPQKKGHERQIGVEIRKGHLEMKSLKEKYKNEETTTNDELRAIGPQPLHLTHYKRRKYQTGVRVGQTWNIHSGNLIRIRKVTIPKDYRTRTL